MSPQTRQCGGILFEYEDRRYYGIESRSASHRGGD